MAFTDYPSRSEYSLKSEMWNSGSWSVKNGVAIFTSRLSNRIDSYSKETLELAIQNVKHSRSSYVTNDSYWAHLFHLQFGLTALIVATNA